MSEALEREEQIVSEVPVEHRPVHVTEQIIAEIADEQQLEPEIRGLIARLLDGTEDYGRELKVGEPAKFSPSNIATIMLVSAGFRQREAADIIGVHHQRVCTLVNHPYGRKLLAAMAQKHSGRVLDIKTRLEEYAGELLDRVYSNAMTTGDLKIQSNITFAMLDRAGFGPTQKIESKSEVVETAVSDATVNRLATALEESARVNSSIMPFMKTSVPPAVGGEVIGTSQAPSPGAEGGFSPSSQSDSPLKRLAESND